MHSTDIEAPLRQGDVCAVPHIPVWNFTKSSVQKSPIDSEPDMVVIPTWSSAEKTTENLSLVVVATQCCDLENPQKGNRSGVLIAPLRRVPASQDREAEKYSEIMESGEIDSVANAYRWIQLFPLMLGDDRAVVADLSALTTMAPAAKAVDALREARLWSLADDERHRFRIKLGASLARNPDLERNSE